MTQKHPKKYKVVSLFSGCGGLDLGFIKSGFEVVWANDFFAEATQTYRANIGDHIIYGDITNIPSDDIPNDFDILLGGFPCQGFSIANSRRNMEDERNFLYKELLRVIKDKQPKFFVAENVKGLLSMSGGEIIKMIVKDFESLGYGVDYKVLKASNYGVPQHRERIIIIGNRLDIPNIFPAPTHGQTKTSKDKTNSKNDIFENSETLFTNLNDKLEPILELKPYRTVQEVIGDYQDIPTRDLPFEINNKTIHNHTARTNVADQFWGRKYKVSQEEICDYLKKWRTIVGTSTQKIDKIFGYKHTAGHWFRKDNKSGSIPNPSDWWRLKEILKFDNQYDAQVTQLVLKPISFEQSLRISNWYTPSDTITASGPEIHPNKQRRLSVRECAILQTFPDDFVFCGSLGNMYKQIGNAVPVLMAQKIAEVIKKQLDENNLD